MHAMKRGEAKQREEQPEDDREKNCYMENEGKDEVTKERRVRERKKEEEKDDEAGRKQREACQERERTPLAETPS